MQVQNIEIEENSDYTLSITYRDDLTNLPVDLTSYSAIMDIKPAFGSSYVYLSLTNLNGGLTLGGVTGNIDITIKASDVNLSNVSSGWEKGTYTLYVIDPFTKRVPLLKGFVTIIRV
jgi:hypothetical protein